MWITLLVAHVARADIDATRTTYVDPAVAHGNLNGAPPDIPPETPVVARAVACKPSALGKDRIVTGALAKGCAIDAKTELAVVVHEDRDTHATAWSLRGDVLVIRIQQNEWCNGTGPRDTLDPHATLYAVKLAHAAKLETTFERIRPKCRKPE